MFHPVNIKSSYNFVLLAPAILTLGFTNATVTGIVDYDTAKTVQDVVAMHNAAYPYLPAGTLRDASELIYIKLTTTDGSVRVIAMDWLASAPVQVTTQAISITIGNVTPTDITVIKEILIQNGFSEFSINVITS